MIEYDGYKALFFLPEGLFSIDKKDKEIKVGSIVYDGRKGNFVKIENENDLEKYSYLAPECYGIAKEFYFKQIS